VKAKQVALCRSGQGRRRTIRRPLQPWWLHRWRPRSARHRL